MKGKSCGGKSKKGAPMGKGKMPFNNEAPMKSGRGSKKK